MSNKMLDIFMVILLIASILALIFITRCLIGIFICDYEMWKRKKEDKNRYHQIEDKFKDRKLTD
nr:MAG TPA: cytochrome B6-F complex subunit [Caudoviricetes sp.]